MERNIKFTLETQLYNWTERLRRVPEVTESDFEDLKCHLLDSIDHLKEIGLDEEEAFWVASRRLELKLGHIIFLFLTTLGFAITDSCLMAVSKSLIEPDDIIRANFIQVFRNFDYAFPLIICFNFIILYFQYYRKAKVR
jgi:hypothetical protein